jgi:hypothetical protein
MPMGPWPGSSDDMFLGGMPYGGGMVPGILGGDFDPGGGLPPPSGPNPFGGRGGPYGGGGLPFGGGGLPGGPGGFPPPGAVPPVARHDLISPLLDPDGMSGGGVVGGMGGRGRGRGRGGGRGGFSSTMPSAQRPAPMATMISSPRVPAPTMEPNPSHQPSHPSHSAAAMSRKRADMNQALEAARLEASRRMWRAKSTARARERERSTSRRARSGFIRPPSVMPVQGRMLHDPYSLTLAPYAPPVAAPPPFTDHGVGPWAYRYSHDWLHRAVPQAAPVLLPSGAVTGAVFAPPGPGTGAVTGAAFAPTGPGMGAVTGAAFAPPGPGLGGSLSGGSFGAVSLSSEERDRVRAETLALVRQQVEARLNEVSASEEALLG